MHDWVVVVAINRKTGYPFEGEQAAFRLCSVREEEVYLLDMAKKYANRPDAEIGSFKFSLQAQVQKTNTKIPVVIKGMLGKDFVPIKETTV